MLGLAAYVHLIDFSSVWLRSTYRHTLAALPPKVGEVYRMRDFPHPWL